MAVQHDRVAKFAVEAGRVIAHEELLNRVWGRTNTDSPRVSRIQLMRLRQKQGEDGENPTTSSSGRGWGIE